MIKSNEAIELLKKGATIEQNVTFVHTWYFLRLNGKIVDEVYPQTFRGFKKRGLLKIIERKNNNPDGWLNMSNYYKLKDIN